MIFIDGIINTVKNMVIVMQDSWRNYQYAKRHKFVTVLYMDGHELFEFKGTVTPDLKWVTPKGVNQQKRITKGYVRFPQKDTVYVCSNESPETIDLNHWDIQISDVKKGSILSSIAYDLFRTSIFRYMTQPNKREVILLVIVFSLFFLVIGLMIGSGMGG